MEKPSIGARLLALKDQSQLSLANIAKAGGFRGPSSIQRYFTADYDPEYLPSKVAKKLSEALVGFGSPAIRHSDIDALTEYGFLHERQRTTLTPAHFERAERRYVDCVPTFKGGERSSVDTFLLGSDSARYFMKPEHLYYRAIDAFYVAQISMIPRYQPGEVVFFEQERPASLGADVVVIFTQLEGDALVEVLLGTLIGRTRDTIQIRLLNPEQLVEFDLSQIDDVLPVLPASELLEQVGRKTAYA